MGFLEETKVFLSTRYATYTGNGLSSATWILKTALETLNPLYKLKVKVTGASIPNTFERVSAGLENNKLAIAYSDPGVGLNVADSVRDGKVLKIDVARPFHEGQEKSMVEYINQALLDSTNVALAKAAVRPYFVLDTAEARCAFLAFDYTKSSAISPGADGKPSTLIPGVTGWETAQRTYKLLTQADLTADMTGLTESDVALANVLGFMRFQKTSALKDLDDPNNVFNGINTIAGQKFAGVKAVSRPDAPIDMSGVRFISMVFPELSISNIDPVTLDTSRVVACLPVSSRFQGDSTPVVNSVQDAPYTTVAQDRINRITIKLQDDKGRALKMHHDWFVELSVRIEEPDTSDVYRGTEDLVMPAGAYAGDPDPGRYAELYSELKRNYDALGRAESTERVAQARRFR
jgi:hypothetical protein